MFRLTKLNSLKIFFRAQKYKVYLFILPGVFFFFNFSNLSAQNSNDNVKLFRDKFVQIFPLTNYSSVNLPKLSIKVSPDFASYCSTENRLVMECINCLSNNVINYVSFDLLYSDCNNKSWKKSISIPVNSNASLSIGGKAFVNNQREQIIYGLDDSNKFNTHFIYNAENAGEITNIRVTNNYEGGVQTLTSYGKMPLNIYASNIDGSTNSINNPAEFGTKIILNWKGGELPSGGRWRLYKDKNFTKPIYEGYTDTYSFTSNEIKSSVSFTLILVDKNGSEYNSKKDLNIFVAAIIQIKNEIVTKLASNMYNEADKLCEDLKIILGDNNPEYVKLKKQIIEKKIEAINSLNNPQEKDILELDDLCNAFSLVNFTNVKLNCSFYKIEIYKKLIQSFSLKNEFDIVKELIFKLEKISVTIPEKQFVLLLKKENAENLLNKLFENQKFEDARNLILKELEPLEMGFQYNTWLDKITLSENQIVQNKIYKDGDLNLKWNCKSILETLIQNWQYNLAIENDCTINIECIFDKNKDNLVFNINGSGLTLLAKNSMEEELNKIKFKINKPIYTKNDKEYIVNAVYEKRLIIQLKNYNIFASINDKGDFNFSNNSISIDLSNKLKEKYSKLAFSTNTFFAPSSCILYIKEYSINGVKYYSVIPDNIKKLGGASNFLKSIVLPGLGRTSVFSKSDSGYRKWTTSFISYLSLAGLSIGGKILAENNYNQLQFSNNQVDFDRMYKLANLAQRVSLISGGLGLFVNIADVIKVLKKGSLNEKSPLKFNSEKFILK